MHGLRFRPSENEGARTRKLGDLVAAITERINVEAPSPGIGLERVGKEFRVNIASLPLAPEN